MKFFLAFLIFMPVYSFGKVVIGSIEKDRFGEPLWMSYQDAQKYCKSKNQRLPTGREFIEEAVAHSNAAIIETSFKNCHFSMDDERLVDGCYREIDREINSLPDYFRPFYYDSNKYGGWMKIGFYYKLNDPQKPMSKYSGLPIWTSSPARFAGTLMGDPDETPIKHVIFYPGNSFSDDWNHNPYRFHCAADLSK